MLFFKEISAQKYVKICLRAKIMSEKVEIKTIKFNNGAEVPMVGLGTFGVSF